MIVKQRDIVIAPFKLPQGTSEEHPILVLSNDSLNTFEGGFVGVMISSTTVNDGYGFKLEASMIDNCSLSKVSQVRCQLIAFFSYSDVIPNSFKGRIKADTFRRILDRINDSVFEPEEED